ncbi:MAG: hypothetical protein P8J78_09730 [Maricaulis sp.]|nr:hypothetical protein [Maricaulis sp.]
MTYMEKLNIAGMAVGAVLYGWYLSVIAGRLGSVPIEQLGYKTELAFTLLGFVVLITVAAIVIAIFDHKELKDNADGEDERDKKIYRNGDLISGNVLGGFVTLLLIVVCFVDLHTFWVANALMASIVLSGIIGQLVKMLDYRLG